MGQGDILELLEKKRIPLAVSEIAKELETNKVVIWQCIAKLIKHKEIKIIELDRKLARKFYNSARRMQLFYV